jgi:GNAT superfamily N-acetyltransferase
MSVTYKLINDVFRGRVFGNHDIFTAQSFRDFAHRHDVALTRAINAYDEDAIAGTLLYGLRGDRVWFSLVGVLPAYRRSGLGRVMLMGALDAVDSAGARTIEFEAYMRNHPLHAMCAGVGFREVDQLGIWARTPRKRATNDLRFKKRSVESIQAIANATAACWQREPLGVSRAASSALIECDGAYAFVRVRDEHAVILDAGARNARAADELVRELDARVPYDITLLNEPEGSALSGALGRARWRLIERQQRMLRTR